MKWEKVDLNESSRQSRQTEFRLYVNPDFYDGRSPDFWCETVFTYRQLSGIKRPMSVQLGQAILGKHSMTEWSRLLPGYIISGERGKASSCRPFGWYGVMNAGGLAYQMVICLILLSAMATNFSSRQISVYGINKILPVGIRAFGRPWWTFFYLR